MAKTTIPPAVDYGGLYRRRPAQLLQPTTVDELAKMLKSQHQAGQPVTVRNTGHSTNGQTLTDGTQLHVGRIQRLDFDAGRGLVSVGPGNTWDSVIQGVQFPRFCPAVFPNNPGQQIHIGGTAAVGGVGYYSSRHGGFWNHVESLKLVTMRGDIIECSATREPQLFRHALGGFGRIGVIADLTLRVIPSKPSVVAICMIYADRHTFYEDFETALQDPELCGVIAQDDLSGWEEELLRALGLDLKLIVVMTELEEGQDSAPVVDGILGRYREQSHVFVEAQVEASGLEMRLTRRAFQKRDIVYYSPVEDGFVQRVWKWLRGLFLGRDAVEFVHPYVDCIVDKAHYAQFVEEAARILRSSDMARFLEKESFLGGVIQMDSFATFGIKRMSADPAHHFPLSLDLPGEFGHARGVAIMPRVPRGKQASAMKVQAALTDLVYQLGGRRYLYGTHGLTVAQVEQHYGRDVLETWQRLKDEHDPKRLLNIGVIEHLDD